MPEEPFLSNATNLTWFFFFLTRLSVTAIGILYVALNKGMSTTLLISCVPYSLPPSANKLWQLLILKCMLVIQVLLSRDRRNSGQLLPYSALSSTCLQSKCHAIILSSSYLGLFTVDVCHSGEIKMCSISCFFGLEVLSQPWYLSRVLCCIPCQHQLESICPKL